MSVRMNVPVPRQVKAPHPGRDWLGMQRDSACTSVIFSDWHSIGSPYRVKAGAKGSGPLFCEVEGTQDL